jgi:hypothetical protein
VALVVSPWELNDNPYSLLRLISVCAVIHWAGPCQRYFIRMWLRSRLSLHGFYFNLPVSGFCISPRPRISGAWSNLRITSKDSSASLTAQGRGRIWQIPRCTLQTINEKLHFQRDSNSVTRGPLVLAVIETSWRFTVLLQYHFRLSDLCETVKPARCSDLSKPVNGFPDIYETGRLITVFTRSRYPSLHSARSIQCTHFTYFLIRLKYYPLTYACFQVVPVVSSLQAY